MPSFVMIMLNSIARKQLKIAKIIAIIQQITAKTNTLITSQLIILIL